MYRYLDGETDSINLQLGKTSMVQLELTIDLPKHSQIRKRLVEQEPKEQIVLVKGAIVSTRTPLPNHQEELTLIPAFFVGCISPNAVYFRTPKLAKRFIELQNDLRSHFEAQLMHLPEGRIKLFVGFNGALQSGDRWFRAKVVDVGNYPEIGVYLVDVALFLYVNAKEILHLPDEFKTRPMTLLCLSFSGVHPPSGVDWDPKATKQ